MPRPTAWWLASNSSATRSGLPDDGRARGPGAIQSLSEVADTGPTLWFLLGVVAVPLPAILAYQAWGYKVLRRQVTDTPTS